MSYKILDHTADAKFRATGETKEEALSETVKAVAEIVGSDPEAGTVRRQIEVESENTESLIFDFLGELIFLQDLEDVAVCQTEKLELKEEIDGPHRIKATVWTQPITPGMNLLDIKAPTYNEMLVDYENEWIIEAVLDI